MKVDNHERILIKSLCINSKQQSEHSESHPLTANLVLLRPKLAPATKFWQHQNLGPKIYDWTAFTTHICKPTRWMTGGWSFYLLCFFLSLGFTRHPSHNLTCIRLDIIQCDSNFKILLYPSHTVRLAINLSQLLHILQEDIMEFICN